MTGAERIIVALDVPELQRAAALVDDLADTGCAFKVGLELLSATGPSIIRSLRERGLRVFADVKLHDIPNTVFGAARALAGQGCWLLTVHVAGGRAMCESALAGAAEGAARAGFPRPRVLGVTVLTSLDDAALRNEVGIERTVAAETLRRAQLAVEWGLDGVVCSPLEAERLRPVVGPDRLLVTPGVRPRAAAAGDQRRVATPGDAILRGADFVVIGRPVHAADDPRAALRAIAREVGDALAAR